MDRYCRSCGSPLHGPVEYAVELHRAINEAVPLGVFILDGSLRVRYWNRALEELSGLQRRHALGKRLNAVLPQLQECAHRIQGVFASARPFRVEKVVMDRRSEAPVTEAYWFGPLVLTDGSAAVVGVVEDVTHRLRLDTQLLRSERLTAIGELAAGVAHNFNNILAAIGGDAQLLKMAAEEELLPPHVAATAQQITDQTMRGGRIAHDLLSFARGAAPQIQPLDPRVLIEDAVRLMLNHPAARLSRIEVAIDRELPQVEGDAHLLQQVLFNLMLNALQAMPGGGTLTVAASLRGDEADPRRGMLDLKLHDTGHGIPREHLRRVFDPFFSRRVDGGSGTGMGLPVSLALVKSIGGDIQIASAERIGTTVTISLPIVERRSAPRRQRRQSGARVVVVEADASLCRTLTALFLRRGFEATGCPARAAVLEELERPGPEGRPELLVLEWDPDAPGGAAFLQEIQSVLPGIPVIALAGASGAEVLVEALEAGARFVFSKPPNFTQLLAAAEALVQQARSRTPEADPV
jgi:PAS domain S-box-containing protein